MAPDQQDQPAKSNASNSGIISNFGNTFNNIPNLENTSDLEENTTNPVEISELNDSTVNSMLNGNPLFVLDCYAQWCEPCKDLSTALCELSSDLKGQVAFGMIDVERNSETAEKYNINTYPTILFFRNGTLVDSQIGYGSKSELVMRLEIIQPTLNVSDVKPDMAEAPLVEPPSNFRSPRELEPFEKNISETL